MTNLKSNKFILGIDPGKTGALALLPINRLSTPIFRMNPIEDIGFKTVTRSTIDGNTYRTFLNTYKDIIEFAIVENQWARKFESPVGAFTLGHGTGKLEQGLQSAKIPIVKIDPKKWQKIVFNEYTEQIKNDIGDSEFIKFEGKPLNILFAKKLHPGINLVPEGKRTERDGIADALLIAEAGLLLYERGELEYK